MKTIIKKKTKKTPKVKVNAGNTLAWPMKTQIKMQGNTLSWPQ